MKLKLEDLVPAESSFILSEKPGKTYTLKKFSLREQIWIRERFGSEEKLKEIFETQDLASIAEIVHHLLKDKTDFPKFLDFAECIVTIADKIAVLSGVLATIGISQPIIEQITKDQTESSKGEAPSPNELSPPNP